MNDQTWAGLRARALREARRHLPAAAAEDVAQEAMLRAWRRWDTCRDERGRGAWVAAIARNESHRWHARHGDLPPAGDDAGDALAGRAGPPGLDEERIAAVLDVRDALARLTAADRRLVALRYGDDLTQAEIARRTGVPPGTIAVRLHRLRSRLRDDLSSS